MYDARSNLEVKLSSVLKEKEWDWLPARSEDLINIQSKLPMVKIGERDKHVWVISRKGTYTSAETWNVILSKHPEVDWWKLIWLPLAISKQAFVLWLAMKNSLITRERMLKWGYKGDVNCVFFLQKW